MAKQLAAEASWAAADMCVQTHGGFGFAEEFDIERKFRETRLYHGGADLDQSDPVLHRRARARPAAVVLNSMPQPRTVIAEVRRAAASEPRQACTDSEPSLRGALRAHLRVTGKAMTHAAAARRPARRLARTGGRRADVLVPARRRRRARHQDRAAGGRFRPRLRRRWCTARAAISSGSTAARNRWCSISTTADDKALLEAMLAQRRRVRAEPQARRDRQARLSRSSGCGATIRG